MGHSTRDQQLAALADRLEYYNGGKIVDRARLQHEIDEWGEEYRTYRRMDEWYPLLATIQCMRQTIDRLDAALRGPDVDESAALAALARLRAYEKDMRRLLKGYPVRGRGRPDDWPKDATVMNLAGLYESLVGRRAAASNSVEDGGPFVRFLRGALPLIDPSLICPSANTINAKLKERRKLGLDRPEQGREDDND